jgi:hypothetical protein
MKICLLTWWGDSLTYTVARALSEHGHDVDILLTDRERHLNAKWGNSRRIREIARAKIYFDAADLADKSFDLLLIQSYRGIRSHAAIAARLGGQAKVATLISFGDLARGWPEVMRLQFEECRITLPFRHKVKKVAYKDGHHVLDLFALLGRTRVNVGFDAHSKFLHDDTLYRQIHDKNWDASSPRPLRLNFVGSRDPQRRGEAVDQVARFLMTSVSKPDREARVMWKAYSDEKPEALPECEFVEILTKSDFTLAPPGYSLITHRPIEAMLRGSIPILNESEAPIYEVGLRDGENCLLVRNDHWSDAVSRALQASQGEIKRMRQNILRIRNACLDYPTLSAAICRRLGAAG